MSLLTTLLDQLGAVVGVEKPNSATVQLNSPAAQRMLDNLPPYYADDVAVLAYLEVVGREIDRAEEALDTITTEFFPQNATDQYRMLGIWESLVGLPPEQTGSALAARQNAVISRVRGRRSGSAQQWADAVTAAVNSTAWAQKENYPDPYQLSVTIPYNPTSVAAAGVAQTIRDITPAHVQLIVGYDGYIVDVSTVDNEPV